MEQADGIMVGIVGAEAVGADHLGKAIGFMRGRRFAAAAHFAEADSVGGLGQLPGGLRAREAPPDELPAGLDPRLRWAYSDGNTMDWLAAIRAASEYLRSQ